MTSGMGFIAVALVYFGGWRPVGVLLGALLFSMVIAFQLWLQVMGAAIPSDLAGDVALHPDHRGPGPDCRSGYAPPLR